MKKISILGLHLNYGGIERAIINEANALSTKYDVELAISYKLRDFPAFYLSPKVKVVYLTDVKPNRKELDECIKKHDVIGFIKEAIKSIKILHKRRNTMKKYIEETDSDIILSSRIEFTKLLKYSNKNVIRIGEEHKHHNNNQKYIKKVKRAFKKVDYLVNVSTELNDFYTGLLKKTKCIYIPNSLDEDKVEVSNLKTKNVISVGRLSHEKGFLDLIEVFKKISEKEKEAHLDIVGDGNEREAIEEKIKEYNLEDKVTLHGFQGREYINELMKNSSLYILCSYEESFGLVLIEAGNFGLPQMAFTSAQGACQIIENNKSGYLIENRNINEMAKKAISLLNDKDKLHEFGIEAKKISNIYSFENVKKMWINFIENEVLKNE